MRRVWTYIWHRLTSWNTSGEGIHSPYLFYLVRMLFYDRNSYYSWQDIEQCRRAMRASSEVVDVEDWGTGTSGLRRVSTIARNCLESPTCGQILFRLVTFLGQEAGRPLQICELGTCLGITTSYLAMPDRHNEVTTFEGSTALARLARHNWQKLGVDNIRCLEGNIDDTLYIYIKEQGARNKEPGTRNQEPGTKTLDLAYIDANHTYEATIRYFEALLPLRHEKTIFVLDDIHHSQQMERAWREIQSRPEVTTTMDFFDFGLVFVDPHYIKRHYKLRL